MTRAFALIAAALALWPRPASATFCLSPPLAEVVGQAAAVFEGTVTARVRLPNTGAIDPSYRVSLADVRAWRGPATDELIHTTSGAMVVGHRYLIAAHRGADGRLVVAPCVGLVRPAARSKAWRAWFESLGRPSRGGQLFGAVVVMLGAKGPDDWTSVAGARVTVDGPGGRREALTDADGEYTVGALGPGRYAFNVSFAGRTDLVAPKAGQFDVLGPDAVIDLTLQATVNSRVSGRVVDGDGRAVPGAQLYMQLAPGADPASRAMYGSVTTGPDGEYVFTGGAPGRYHVTTAEPFVPAYARTSAGSDEITLAWAEHLVLAPLVVEREQPIDVPVFVVAAGQASDAEVHVERLGRHGPLPPNDTGYFRASRDGRFEHGLGRGVRYRLTVEDAAGSPLARVETIADGTPIRIELPR
jgi:hypothetical protein